MIKNYIWDFDGTLYDTYPGMTKAAVKTLHYFGYTLSEKEAYYTMKKYSTKQLHESYGLSEEVFSPLFHRYEKEESGEAQPFTETKEVLKKLKTTGGRHYILTHRVTQSTWDLLKKDQLDGLIEEVLGIDQPFPRKPDPASLNHLIETNHLNRAETMMIGDRRLDIEAGINAQVKTCLYDIDHFLGDIPATYQVDNLKGILQIDTRESANIR